MKSPRRPKAIKAVKVRVCRLPHAADLPLPEYQSEGAAGLDLVAAVDQRRPIKLARGAWVLVPTGLVLELPAGTEAQVRPRSGLAFKHGVTVLNAPGTIDRDYRGEVQVLLVNHGPETFVIRRGERIAQLVVQKVERADLVLVDGLGETSRGAGGFGSTGTMAAPARTPVKRAIPAGLAPSRASASGAGLSVSGSSSTEALAPTKAGPKGKRGAAKPEPGKSGKKKPADGASARKAQRVPVSGRRLPRARR